MCDGVWRSGDQHTIPEALLKRLESDPDGEYLDVNGTKLTAAEVWSAACRISNALRELGVAQHERVATLVENSSEAVLSWWGTVVGGQVSVPINTAYKGDYLRHQLRDSGSRVLFVEASLLHRAVEVVDDIDGLDHLVVIGDAELPQVASATSHRWHDVLDGDDTPPEASVRPSDLGTFVDNGGTTGPSKGCMLSHNYHYDLASQIGYCWGRTPEDVVWTPLPLFHFNALTTAVLGALVFGGRSAIYRKFSVSDFWPEVNRTGATIASTLGTMAYLLAHDADRPEMPKSGAPQANTSLRMMVAAPLPVEVDEILRNRFGVETFSGGYGVTEASLISWSPPGVRNKPNAAGVINDEYFDVRIFDDDDNELPRGADGEIVIRPKKPHVMLSSAPSSRAALWAGCSSASCANKASPPPRGTPKPPASPMRSARKALTRPVGRIDREPGGAA